MGSLEEGVNIGGVQSTCVVPIIFLSQFYDVIYKLSELCFQQSKNF